MSEQPRSTGLSARQTLLLRDRLRAARTAAVAHDPIPRQSRQNTNPTSFGQQRLHYLYELYPESSAYHLQLRCTINGPLDVARLGSALAGVVARHQTLHSVIRWIDGELRAEPRPELSLETTVIDVTELGSVDQNRAVDKSVTADGQQRFELHTVFPVRATVLRRSPASHVLLLTFHHIAVDERSLDLILQQIADGYSTTDPTNSQTADVDGPTYADFAAWQRQSSTDLIAARQYWCSRLQKPPAEIHLPVDDSSLDTSTLRGHQVSGEIPLNVAAQLRQLAVEQNVTPFILQLAAFNVLLHRYSAATDLVVGTPVSNRTRPELRNVVGFFVETLPLRSDLSGQLSFVDLLQQVRHTVTEAFQHAVLPFEKIVKAVNPERISRRNPLFNVMFASQTVPNTIQLADGLTLTPQIIDSGASKFDLTMFAGDL
ncbi:MAG: condensation domain-containing protein, partial [Planctomycetaceae bacterium]